MKSSVHSNQRNISSKASDRKEGSTDHKCSSHSSNEIDFVPSARSKYKSIRLSDLMAAMYPGVKVGHKHCAPRPVLVPGSMGWLWNTEDTATGVPVSLIAHTHSKNMGYICDTQLIYLSTALLSSVL